MSEKLNNSKDTIAQSQYFDVVISGGGLSGSLMALSLLSVKSPRDKPLSIAIIESANKNEADNSASDHNVFDARVLALSHASAKYLKTLNIWSLIKNYAQPITDIRISDRGKYGKARIKANQYINGNNANVAAVGYVIEMSILGLALHQALKKMSKNDNTLNDANQPRLTWFTPDSINTIKWKPESVDLTLSSKTTLSAALLIGCDGAQSICRTSANIACKTSHYQQSAVITNVSTAKPHNGIAYERFTPNGPIAMLPMVNVPKVGSCSSLVWTLTPTQAQEINSLSDDDFKIRLEQCFGSWLGKIENVGKRTSYPLSLVQAHDQIYHRMVLVGNASHTIHPIAGQGFNLGLRDVQTFTEVITTALYQNKDIGSFHLLSGYAESRKKDHRHIIRLTDSLVTLFSNDLFPLVLGRNIALKALNYSSTIKKTFVNKTMGY